MISLKRLIDLAIVVCLLLTVGLALSVDMTGSSHSAAAQTPSSDSTPTPTPPATAQQTAAQPTTCSELVDQAFAVVDDDCATTGSNQACYAHARLDAIPQPHAQTFVFEQAGDIADVVDLQSLRMSPMDVTSGWWGVGLMRLRTYTVNQNARQEASILLFGDVQIANTVDPATVTRALTIATNGASARVRVDPYGYVVAALSDGDTVTATGRLADNTWVRIELPETQRSGWVHTSLIAEDRATIETLGVVEPTAARYAPMQAFAFTSGQDDAACDEAPNSGLIIQTPEGNAEVTFLINEVDIHLGSTAFLQANPGATMALYLVEGTAEVTADGVTTTLIAGTMASVPLDESGMAAGVPSLPEAYALDDLQGFPVGHLDRAIEVAPPLDDAALAQLIADNLSTDTSDDTVADTVTDPAANPPAQAGPPSGDTSAQPPKPDQSGGGGGGDDGGGGDTGGGGDGGGDDGGGDDGGDDDGGDDGNEKITICHNGKTITISIDAWPAHEAQGDTMGPCPVD